MRLIAGLVLMVAAIMMLSKKPAESPGTDKARNGSLPDSSPQKGMPEKNDTLIGAVGSMFFPGLQEVASGLRDGMSEAKREIEDAKAERESRGK